MFLPIGYTTSVRPAYHHISTFPPATDLPYFVPTLVYMSFLTNEHSRIGCYECNSSFPFLSVLSRPQFFPSHFSLFYGRLFEAFFSLSSHFLLFFPLSFQFCSCEEAARRKSGLFWGIVLLCCSTKRRFPLVTGDILPELLPFHTPNQSVNQSGSNHPANILLFSQVRLKFATDWPI